MCALYVILALPSLAFTALSFGIRPSGNIKELIKSGSNCFLGVWMGWLLVFLAHSTLFSLGQASGEDSFKTQGQSLLHMLLLNYEGSLLWLKLEYGAHLSLSVSLSNLFFKVVLGSQKK